MKVVSIGHADRATPEAFDALVASVDRYFEGNAKVMAFAVGAATLEPMPEIDIESTVEKHTVYKVKPTSEWEYTRFVDQIDDVAVLRYIVHG